MILEASNLAFYSTFELVNSTWDKYMKRCIELAKKGKFKAAPNPRVGSIIVHGEKIIGEGFHQEYGKAHAEVNAINSVKDKSLLKDSTLFVNLEPCAHFGKTPPCADLIIKHQIPRVVIANIDPFKEVNGGGITRLREQGIDVTTGILEQEGKDLNRRFFTFHSKKRPFVILKWAQTSDGFISRESDAVNQNNNWITSSQSKQLVHAWRSEETAILVGKNTVLIDNPQLTCREVSGKSPIRVVIDQNLRLKGDFHIFNQEVQTIIINGIKDEIKGGLAYHKIAFDEKSVERILEKLYDLGIQSILVEGGTFTLEQFIQTNLWDEARVFIGNKTFEKGLKAPLLSVKPLHTLQINTDILNTYRNNKA